MESGGDKNRTFIKWIKSLPKDRRKDELQRIVSGGVLRGTSAKQALFKLQKRCYVKLRRLDIVRGMVACATASPSTSAAPSCTPSPCPSPTPCSPLPASCQPRRLPAASRPCPLSRKRPADTDGNGVTKRRAVDGAASSKSSASIDAVTESRTSEDPSACRQTCQSPAPSSELPLPCAVPDLPRPEEPQSSDLPRPQSSSDSLQSEKPRSPGLKEPTGLQSSDNVQPQSSGHEDSTDLQSPDLPQAKIPHTLDSVQLKGPQSGRKQPKDSQSSMNAPSPSIPPQPASSITQLHQLLLNPRKTAPQQRVSLSSRVIDEALKDVARNIADVETELVNIDKKLYSFEKLPPSHKSTRTISALVETATLISLKAAAVTSCIDRGIAHSLGHSFYPKLLSEVNKIPHLKLYSSLRLNTMVSLLLNLSKPDQDPKFTVHSLIAQNLNEWRPAENKKEPKKALPKSQTAASRQVQGNTTPVQVSLVSQTASNVRSDAPATKYPVGNVEQTPRQPQAPPPNATIQNHLQLLQDSQQRQLQEQLRQEMQQREELRQRQEMQQQQEMQWQWQVRQQQIQKQTQQQQVHNQQQMQQMQAKQMQEKQMQQQQMQQQQMQRQQMQEKQRQQQQMQQQQMQQQQMQQQQMRQQPMQHQVMQTQLMHQPMVHQPMMHQQQQPQQQQQQQQPQQQQQQQQLQLQQQQLQQQYIRQYREALTMQNHSNAMQQTSLPQNSMHQSTELAPVNSMQMMQYPPQMPQFSVQGVSNAPVSTAQDLNIALLHTGQAGSFFASQQLIQVASNNPQMIHQIASNTFVASQGQLLSHQTQAHSSTFPSSVSKPPGVRPQVAQPQLAQPQLVQSEMYQQPRQKSVIESTGSYQPYISQPPQNQQGFPVDRVPETAAHISMTGQEQNGYQLVNQASPVARTSSRDSGIDTPEPPQYEESSYRPTAATWKGTRLQ